MHEIPQVQQNVGDVALRDYDLSEKNEQDNVFFSKKATYIIIYFSLLLFSY